VRSCLQAHGKLTLARETYQRTLVADKLQREREEAARKAREEKKKKDDALLQTMDREKRRKFEEKQRKEALAKSAPRLKFKAM
jgi:hypothetical protein